MTYNVYLAMKSRISVLPYDPYKTEYEQMGWRVSPYDTFYYFNNDGLNEGVDCDEVVNSIVVPMKTKNLYNVCQRIYSIICFYAGIDERILNNPINR